MNLSWGFEVSMRCLAGNLGRRFTVLEFKSAVLSD